MSQGLKPARQFNSWILLPLSRLNGMITFSEAWHRSIVWSELDLLATVREKGRQLFQTPLAEQNRRWREFSNFVRQARAYDDAAQATRGSSRALLLYYAALNLAKAELLVTNASEVLDQPIHHGLSPRLSASSSIEGDEIRVRSGGVFPLLYRKRTGQEFPAGERLSAARVLAQVREIGSNLYAARQQECRTIPVAHAVVADQEKAWSILALHRGGFLSNRGREVSRTELMRSYESVQPPTNWKDIFAFSKRFIPNELMMLQGRWMRNVRDSGTHYDTVRQDANSRLMNFLDSPHDGSAEALLSPSLYKSRELFLPVSLARYVAMFYLSSLVRYRPSRLDPNHTGADAWLLDSFAEESGGPLITNALEGITNIQYAFMGMSGRT